MTSALLALSLQQMANVPHATLRHSMKAHASPASSKLGRRPRQNAWPAKQGLDLMVENALDADKDQAVPVATKANAWSANLAID